MFLKTGIFLIICLYPVYILSKHTTFIQDFCLRVDHPFPYDLGIKLIPSKQESSSYMLCFHGSGANNTIADTLQSYNVISDNLISFNFPDHNKDSFDDDPKLSTFGSIQELLPALYVLKNVVIDGGLRSINMYGFSAGGGVLVNVLAILSSSRFEKELETIGITLVEKSLIISAISNGLIILDCSLKSIEEIIAFRGGINKFLDNMLEIYADHYRENNLRPIDSIACWKDLNLTILLYFEVPDEKLSNRDDDLYINLIRQHNLGTTHVVFGSHGGHCVKHDKLWETYSKVSQ